MRHMRRSFFQSNISALRLWSAASRPMLHITSLAAFGLFCGCSGSPTSSPSTIATAPAAAAVVTVSDAPLSNILSAVVTLSSVDLKATGASASVPLLTKPVTVELSGLGAVQEPIELTTIPLGTYNSAALTVTSAQVTYLNSAGQPTTAMAALNQPAITVALTPALAISDQGEVQLQLAFNLAQSFSLSGSAVTFTPAINTAAAQVSTESQGDRLIEVTGQALSINASSIILQSGDSARQFTFATNTSTQFANGSTAASIQQGSIVQVEGQTQTDGTLMALTVSPESNGDSNNSQQEDGAKGIVVSVTQGATGTITGFSMAPRESFGSSSTSGGTIDVQLSSATAYGLPQDALNAGLAAGVFNATEIFPGQSVLVTGTAGNSPSSPTINAQRVMLAAESLSGMLAAAPQATSTGFSLTLTLPATSYLTLYLGVPALRLATAAGTDFANGLTTTNFAASSSGTNIETHGYLVQDGTGKLLLLATKVAQVSAPEVPESTTDN